VRETRGGLLALLVVAALAIAVSRYLAGCSISVESGIHDSLHADQEVQHPTPTPTPAH
jgi:hypothetical protein